MNIREESYGTLDLAGAMRALELINELEADGLTKTVKFVELQHAPDLSSAASADHVGKKLLNMGVGVRIAVHWPFKGTVRWALQTEMTRVVSRSP